MIYTIGIHIASHFFMRGDNKIVVLDGSVDAGSLATIILYQILFVRRKSDRSCNNAHHDNEGTLAETTLETGRPAASAVNFGAP